MAAARTASVVFLGSDAALNATLARIEGKLKALSTVAEEQNAKTASSADRTGARIGQAYEAGTAKAGFALDRLGKQGAAMGVPLSGALSKVGKQFDETALKADGLHAKLERLGKVTLTAGALGFGAAAFEGVKGAMALQQSMERIATQAGATQAQVNQMTKAVTSMAPGLATGPQALSDSLYHAFSATRNMTESLHIMSAAARESKISGANLTDTTTALTAAVFSGIKGAKDYTQAMGLLNATVGAGDMKFQDLNEAFAGPMLAVTKGYGLSLKDVGAALATFGDLNIRGADAATQLRMAVQYMAKPAATAAPLLEKLGLNTHSFANAMANGGLMPALQLLHDKLAAAGVQGNQMAQVIGDLFTKKGAAGVTILENSLGRLDQKYQQVGQGASKENAAWAATQKTLAFQMDQLKATVQALADRFGLYLIPKLEATRKAIGSVIDWLGKHKVAANALAATITGVLGAAVSVFAYQKAAAFIGAVGRMGASLVGLGVDAEGTAGAIDVALGATGVGLVVVGLGLAADQLATHWSDAMSAMKTAAQDMVTVVDGALNKVIDGLNKAIQAFNDTLGQLTGSIGKIGHITPGGGVFGSGVSNGSMMDVRGGGVAPYKAPSNLPLTSGHGPVWQQVAGALEGQGISKVAVAGMLGNFAQETAGGSVRGINTRDSGTGASGYGGMGLANWTQGRRIAEMQYAALHKESPTSVAAQVGYLIGELRTTYHSVFVAMQNAKTPEQAAAIFVSKFEKGTDPGGVRERAAAQAYAMLGGAAGGGGAATGHGLSNRGLNALLDTGKTKHGSHTLRELLYANPLAGDSYNVSRTDQGKDYANIRGPLGAIGAGVITLAQNLPGFGQTIVERLTSGPDKGQSIYYGLETGATGVGLRAGQRVRAGQAVAQGRGSGALELGFWDPKTGHALDNQGFDGHSPTAGGQAFVKFMQSLGSRGIFQTVNTLTGAVSGGNQSNIGYTIAQAVAAYQKAWAAYVAKLGANATSELTRLGNVMQSGTIRGLSALLGENTSTQTFSSARGAARNWGGHDSVANLIGGAFDRLGGGASFGQINAATGSALAAGAANSPQEAAFNRMIDRLDATHNKGLEKLATRLVAAHESALQALGQELYAQQVTKNAELVSLQATQTKDLTSKQANYDAAMLNVQKAWYQMANDKEQAKVTAIRDMTTVVQNQFAGMVQAVTDSAKLMSDAASATVQGIQDQTQVQVDILGERGLYGLNLVAQKLQVQLDQTKASDNQQIALAQQNLDQVTATWHAATSTAQTGLDQLTAQQDALVSQAQMGADLVSIQQLSRIAAAQARMDAVTLHEDVTMVGPAAMAVDLGANLPKAEQDVLNARLKWFTAGAASAEATAGAQYQGVYDSAQGIIGGAGQTVTDAQNAAGLLIGLAGLNLTSITGQANQAIAGAQGLLTGAQSTAALNEAPLSSGVALTQARASTQFSGGGLVINQYGVNLSSPSSVSNETSWAVRLAVR